MEEVNFIKIVLVGDSNVGKTCLARCLTNEPFSEGHNVTAAPCDSQTVQITVEGRPVTLKVSDTPGREQFRGAVALGLAGAHAVVIVCDSGSQSSLSSVNGWMAEVDKHVPPTVPRVLVGNKSDLVHDDGAAKNVAQNLGLPFVEVSAKTGVNVAETLLYLLSSILQEAPIEATEGKGSSSSEVDPQVAAIMRNLTSDEIDMLRDAFIHMDMDSDGLVSLEEMMRIVLSVQGEEKFEPMRQYLEPIFHVADKDQDGKLSLTEFLSSFAVGPGVVPSDVINACVSSIRVRLTDDEISALQESFQRIDQNKDGFIDRDELLIALKEILLQKFPDISNKTFYEIVTVVMASADADHDGKLSLSEFIRSFQEDQGVLPSAFCDVRAQHVARQLSREEVEVLKEVFGALDRNHDGFIDYAELYQALWEALQSSITNKDQVRELCDLIMATADRNKEGRLSLKDFVRNFVQNNELMQIPVAAAQDRTRRATDKLQELFDSGELERMVCVFQSLDTNKDGFLDRSELESILSVLLGERFPEWDTAVLCQVMDAIISAADTDKDGRLSLDEFIQSFVEGQGVLPPEAIELPAERILSENELQLVIQSFHAMDTDLDGYISFHELQSALAEALGARIENADQLTRVTDFVMGQVDSDSDGLVSLKEFVRSFQQDQSVLPIATQIDEPPSDEAREPRPQSPVSVVQVNSVAPVLVRASPQKEEKSSGSGDRTDAVSHDVSGVAISEEQLQREFNKFDRNNSGYLDRSEFKKYYMKMEHFGLEPTSQDVDRLFSKYGGADLKVSFDEFCIIMLQRSKM